MCIRDSSGSDGEDVGDERVDENEIGEEVSQEVREGAGDACDEYGSDEQREDAEEVQCQTVDLDYVDEEGEIVEKKEVEKEEIVVEDLDDEHNPKRSESSEVSCLDSDSEETSQYSSTRDNFLESGVRKQRIPKVRHRKVKEEVKG